MFPVCLFRSFGALGVTLTVLLTVCVPSVIAIIWSSRRGAAVGWCAVAALGLAVAGLALRGLG